MSQIENSKLYAAADSHQLMVPQCSMRLLYCHCAHHIFICLNLGCSVLIWN